MRKLRLREVSILCPAPCGLCGAELGLQPWALSYFSCPQTVSRSGVLKGALGVLPSRYVELKIINSKHFQIRLD